MPTAISSDRERNWEEALLMLRSERQEIIRYLLRLHRDAWRVRPVNGGWNVAQMLEHLIRCDRVWRRMLMVAIRTAPLFPSRERFLRSRLAQPFGHQPMKASRLLGKPRGRMRRKAMVGAFDQTVQNFEYRIEQLSDRRRGQLRFYSPTVGIVGVADWLLLIHYHDVHHFDQMQRIVASLRKRGIPVERVMEETEEV